MALHVAAQDKVKLSGRVIDDEQNPVLFAVVKVDGQAAGCLLYTSDAADE